MLIIASLVLALLSWRFVEQPFRRRGRALATRQVLVRGGVAMAALALVGLATVPLSYRLWPVNADALAALNVLNGNYERHFRDGICFAGTSEQVIAHKRECLTPSRDKPNVLLLGDSHAAQLWDGLARHYPARHFMQATVAGCTPAEISAAPDCDDLTRYLLEEFLPRNHVGTIILSGRWQAKQLEAIRAMADRLAGLADRVVVIGPFQEYSLPFAEVVARARYAHDPALVERYRLRDSIALDRAMAAAFRGSRFGYFSAIDNQCARGCPTVDEAGKLLMFDNDHFTSAGSLYFARHAPPGALGL